MSIDTLSRDVSFLKALYEEMTQSTDPKFKEPLEWATALYKAIAPEDQPAEHHNYMAANLAAEIVSNVNMIEHMGIYIHPTGVFTSLESKNELWPLFYYKHDKVKNTVEVDIALRNKSDNRFNTTFKHGVKPLVIRVDPNLLTKPEDDSKTIITA